MWRMFAFLLNEKFTPGVHGATTAEKCFDVLGDLPDFKHFEEKDWLVLGRFFKGWGATGAVFAPGVLRAFMIAQKKGIFPCTVSYAKEQGFTSDRYPTPVLLEICAKSNLLDGYEISGAEMLKTAKHTKRDQTAVEKNGDKKFRVYGFTEEYMNDAVKVFKRLGIAESIECNGNGIIAATGCTVEAKQISASQLRDEQRFCDAVLDESSGKEMTRAQYNKFVKDQGQGYYEAALDFKDEYDGNVGAAISALVSDTVHDVLMTNLAAGRFLWIQGVRDVEGRLADDIYDAAIQIAKKKGVIENIDDELMKKSLAKSIVEPLEEAIQEQVSNVRSLKDAKKILKRKGISWDRLEKGQVGVPNRPDTDKDVYFFNMRLSPRAVWEIKAQVLIIYSLEGVPIVKLMGF